MDVQTLSRRGWSSVYIQARYHDNPDVQRPAFTSCIEHEDLLILQQLNPKPLDNKPTTNPSTSIKIFWIILNH